MPLSQGDKLGPYEILALLGKGGMGEVYRARDSRLGREVALKVSAERFSERFAREAHAVAALNHPNICTLHDVGPDYLVMELVEGDTLDELMKDGPLPQDEAARIARQIAAALEEAHGKGITHRDLKPSNIKIKPDGTVKVLDFGLAKLGDPPPSASGDSPTLTMRSPTEAGVILGTAAYMAPEQARGKRVDKRADIWAFGVVVYEMLTGRRLFRGDTVTDVLAAVLERPMDFEAVPPAFRVMLRRCLEKDPSKRLRDIGDAMPLLEDRPVEAASARTRPWRVVAAAVAFAFIAAAATWIAFRSPARPEQPLIRLSVDLGLEAYVGPLSTQAAAISPDGTRIVYHGRNSSGQNVLISRLLSQSSASPLPGSEGAGVAFFSADGRWIGFNSGGKIKKIPAEGGPAVTLCDAPNLRGASWAPDGSIIATLDASPGIGLSRIPAEGGTPQQLTKPGDRHEQTNRWPQVLPDGQSVLFVGNPSISNFDEASIEVLSLKTGEIKILERRSYFGRYLPLDASTGYLVYIHEGALFGVAMDLRKLETRGSPEPLLQDVSANSATGAAQFEFSQTGTVVYRNGNAASTNRPMVLLDRSGKMQPLFPPDNTYFTPRWSPDGQRLAYAQNSGKGLDLYIFDLKRHATSRLTFDGLENANPVWTADGNHIVFRSSAASGDSLRWIRAGGGDAIALYESKNALVPTSFSPGDQRLAFTEATAAAGADIWTLPLDLKDPDHPKAAKPEPFLKTPASEYAPAFSPDGHWIAYASDESGRFEVFVRPFPAAAAGGKWQVSTEGGSYPFWSRTANEIFYRGPGDRIFVLPYSASGSNFTANPSQRWSDVQTFTTGGNTSVTMDLAPDGKHFVIFGADTPMPEPLHVTFLLNFFDELRRHSKAAPKS